MVGGVHYRAVVFDSPFRFVADSAYLEGLPFRPHFADDELIFRDGTGLIHRDDPRLTERFHGLQLFDEHIALGHAPHAGREHKRHDDGESLGDDGDRERDDRRKNGHEVLALGESEYEKKDTDDPDDDNYRA